MRPRRPARYADAMPTAEAQHEVRCLEVWGGTEAVEQSLNLPGIDAWVFSRPYAGDEQGGDIHYVSSCFTGRVSRFAIADVSGHGAAVSKLSGTLRKLMRKYINYLDQTGFAQVLNTEFAASATAGIFATAVMMSYFAPTDHLIVCNAGHPRPLWYDASEKAWRRLDHTLEQTSDAPNNLPLGLIDPTKYVQFAVKLSPDDLVVAYTDSMIEARAGGDGALLGEAGLLAMARELPISDPRTFGRALLERVAGYRGRTAPDDDQTLLVLHHNAGEVPNRPIRNSIRYIASMLGLAGD
jgi:sigma-B regulation protein RsbU (phosphoserine phosphatase)